MIQSWNFFVAEVTYNHSGFKQDFSSYYAGPNIQDIRKTHGLRDKVDKVLESVRRDIPSLSHRPTATRKPKKAVINEQSVHPNPPRSHKEFEEFLA